MLEIGKKSSGRIVGSRRESKQTFNAVTSLGRSAMALVEPLSVYSAIVCEVRFSKRGEQTDLDFQVKRGHLLGFSQ
jgi:hypothetical protein